MNAVDHPHGGGRGKSKGNRVSVSPWGMPVCFSLFVTGQNHTHTINRRKEGTRRVSSAIPTSMWYESECATRASVATSSRDACIYILKCIPTHIQTVHTMTYTAGK